MIRINKIFLVLLLQSLAFVAQASPLIQGKFEHNGVDYTIKQALPWGAEGESYVAVPNKESAPVLAVKLLGPFVGVEPEAAKQLSSSNNIPNSPLAPMDVNQKLLINVNGAVETKSAVLVPFYSGQTLAEIDLCIQYEADIEVVSKKLRAMEIIAESLVVAAELLRERNLVHTDIKPENIVFTEKVTSLDDIISRKAKVRVIDTSTAKVAGHPYALPDRTEKYAAPEQLETSKLSQMTHATDFWAIGRVLHTKLFTKVNERDLLEPGKSVFFDLAVKDRFSANPDLEKSRSAIRSFVKLGILVSQSQSSDQAYRESNFTTAVSDWGLAGLCARSRVQ